MLIAAVILIVAVSCLIIAVPFIRGDALSVYESGTETSGGVSRQEVLADKIESTRLALKDLDLENKIGKIAQEDFNFLKSELLKEWADAEAQLEGQVIAQKQNVVPQQKMQSVPPVKNAVFCPRCGQKIKDPADRFCSACGQSLKR